jgi:hypothetical protein
VKNEKCEDDSKTVCITFFFFFLLLALGGMDAAVNYALADECATFV